MTTHDSNKPDFLSPDDVESAIRISKPAESAGGMKAVASALKISIEQMGVVRSASTLLDVNQMKGFDCPGCAWPDPDDRRSLVEFCENGAKAIAEEATLHRVDPEFFAQHSVAALADESDYWLSQQGRITHPVYLAPGATHYQSISWQDAFGKIGGALKALSSPNEAVFYTSGRTSNEAAFLYQLFVRLLGTNNMPDCSDLCHESSGYALNQTVGSGKGSVALKDFELADCIIVIGQNPGTNHPRMLTTLQEAARRGCRIISINPLEEPGIKRFKHPQEVRGMIGRGTRIASHHVPVKINGDVALLKGIQKAILESHPEAIDREFIATYTEGFDDYRRDLECESWAGIESGSGISESSIREIAAVIASSKALICCWAMGLTQHRNAVGNIQEIVNLLLLGGHFGRPGTGACPVRGHSNVQGDRTMGIWERPTKEFLDRLGAEFKFTPPYAHGYDTVETIEAMNAGKVKIFFAMGGNFLSATPDTAYTAAGLKRCALTVQVSTKLNRSHLITGKEALILPCLGRTEIDLQASGPQFVTVENSMGVIHSSEGHLNPASADLLSEPAIVAGLAKSALSPVATVDWDHLVADYDRIRDRIERVIPGFEDFNLRVRRPGGFVLPHAVRDRREFKTASGKARFTVHAIPELDVKPGQFVMATIRTHDQYNTTIYGMNDRYRGIHHGRRVVLMNRDDMQEAGLFNGAIVDIISHWRGKERRARNFRIVPYDIPRGCVASYFPETNILVPVDNFAEGSQTPVSKSIVVSFEKAGVDSSNEKTATAPSPRILGLVLTGGESRRMGQDKASLVYGERPQWRAVADSLRPVCDDVFWSCSPDQMKGWGIGDHAILDEVPGHGPASGLHAAFKRFADTTWIIAGCDYPNVETQDFAALISARADDVDVVTFSVDGGENIEPMLSVWEPVAQKIFLKAFSEGKDSPRRAVLDSRWRWIAPRSSAILMNKNSGK